MFLTKTLVEFWVQNTFLSATFNSNSDPIEFVNSDLRLEFFFPTQNALENVFQILSSGYHITSHPKTSIVWYVPPFSQCLQRHREKQRSSMASEVSPPVHQVLRHEWQQRLLNCASVHSSNCRTFSQYLVLSRHSPAATVIRASV